MSRGVARGMEGLLRFFGCTESTMSLFCCQLTSLRKVAEKLFNMMGPKYRMQSPHKRLESDGSAEEDDATGDCEEPSQSADTAGNIVAQLASVFCGASTGVPRC
eukprot:GHVU01032500.1.p3 GENE.GHVU01032500.1~~GHVU01032500.1.p3  ORF type:complete len:104 (+),score=9.43 GHVU01032500.1:1399-1710(+)